MNNSYQVCLNFLENETCFHSKLFLNSHSVTKNLSDYSTNESMLVLLVVSFSGTKWLYDLDRIETLFLKSSKSV